MLHLHLLEEMELLLLLRQLGLRLELDGETVHGLAIFLSPLLLDLEPL